MPVTAGQPLRLRLAQDLDSHLGSDLLQVIVEGAGGVGRGENRQPAAPVLVGGPGARARRP